MPHLPLHLHKPHAQQALIYLQYRRDHNAHGEVFFYDHIVEIQRLLGVHAVVVAVVPHVEVAVEGEAAVFVLGELEGEEGFALGEPDGAEFLFEVGEELWVSMRDQLNTSAGRARKEGARTRTHLLHPLRVLHHLHLRDVVRPRLVPQQFSDLAAQVEELLEDRDVDREAGLVPLISAFAGLGVLGEFELCMSLGEFGMDMDTEDEKEKKRERTWGRVEKKEGEGGRTMGKMSGVLYVTS